jgi:hypothetical protein
MDIFGSVAVSCRVPFRDAITGQTLLDGCVADEMRPDIERALTALPVSMLVQVVFA